MEPAHEKLGPKHMAGAPDPARGWNKSATTPPGAEMSNAPPLIDAPLSSRSAAVGVPSHRRLSRINADIAID